MHSASLNSNAPAQNLRYQQNNGLETASSGKIIFQTPSISMKDSEAEIEQRVQLQDENVQVFIRVRPPFQDEVEDPIFNPSVRPD